MSHFQFICWCLCVSPLSFSQLLKDISQRQRDTRQQKQVDLRRAYITARFTPATLPAFFTLGDQLDYGGFENRALDPGQEYVFFILAELNSTTGVQKVTVSHHFYPCVYNHFLSPLLPVFPSRKLSLYIVINKTSVLKQ